MDLRLPNRLGDYWLRPLALDDADLMHDWIASHDWQEWWGEPEEEWTELAADIAAGAVRGFIFGQAASPIGWIQFWRVGDNRDYAEETGAIYLRELDDDTIGVDISLGDHALMGRGVGSTVLRDFCAALTGQGVRQISIDPDVRNHRAIQAYEKAGFAHHKSYGATYLMFWAGGR